MSGLIGILRARNWHHVVLLEKPAERHLAWSFPVTITDQLEHRNDGPQHFRPAERFSEAADAGGPAAIEILPGQRAAGEGLVSDQGNAQFTAGIENAVGF